MIPLSAAAAAALDELARYYVDRGRDEAIDRLAQHLETACVRYRGQRGLFFPAPRPFPSLAQFSFRWTKQGPYWIAFAETPTGPLIVGLFHDSADIPRRL